MTLVRLSKVESGASSHTSTYKETTTTTSHSIEGVRSSSRARTTRYASRVVAITLLTLSATFILISLLLPTHKQGLSVFTIEPVGHQWIADDGHAESADVFDPIPSGIDKLDTRGSVDGRRGSRRSRSLINRIISDSAGEIEDELVRKSLYTPGNNGKVIWFGLDGPTVWVGTMQICSKSDWHAETICTSASKAAYHVRDLPVSLGDALLALPQKPIAPILLLITAITTILAILVFSLPLLIRSVGSWKGSSGRPSIQHQGSDADLVKPDVADDETAHMPHPTFLGLMILAVILGIAGAAVEGGAIRAAYKAWDKETGDDIGLVFKSAGIASMLPIIPIFLLLATLSAYTPLMIHLFAHYLIARRQRNAPPASPPLQEHGAEIIHRAEISELFAETVADSGKRTSRGSIIFSEISPQSPPVSMWSRMSSRMPTIYGVPEEHEPMPTRRTNYETGGVDEHLENVTDPRRTIDEERHEKSESWGTFGVGQAV